MKRTLLCALVTSSAMFGCATTKPKTTQTESSAPVAAKTAPAAPAPTEAVPDIDALLKGLAVHFDFDRAELTADSRKRLDALADAMRAHPTVHIKVAGNADELGTEEYNLALGQRRADAVKDYLDKLGVAKARVDTVSYGEEKPVDDRHTPDAWSTNRRDDIEKKSN